MIGGGGDLAPLDELEESATETVEDMLSSAGG